MSKKPKAQFISLYEFFKKYDTEEKATEFYETQRWPTGTRCPYCDQKERVLCVPNKKPQPYHCGACRKYFSLKINTIMESSRIPLKTWFLVTYMMTTARKGISSCQISREIGVTQKTAWFMLQRIRESWETQNAIFSGRVEIDEAYLCGKEKNKHANKKLHAGRGAVVKAPVVALKSRNNGRIKAFHVKNTDQKTLHEAIKNNVVYGSMIYTDESRSYLGLTNYGHKSVNHSAGEYIRLKARTNGVESFWALLKRGYYGTFHHFSVQHLDRYVNEFAARHNTLYLESDERFGHMVRITVGKRLTYSRLIAK